MAYEAQRQLRRSGRRPASKLGDVPKSDPRLGRDGPSAPIASDPRRNRATTATFPSPTWCRSPSPTRRSSGSAQSLGELPAAACATRLEQTYGITPYDSDVLVNQGRPLVDYYVELAELLRRRQAGQQLGAAGRAADAQRAARDDRAVPRSAAAAGRADRLRAGRAVDHQPRPRGARRDGRRRKTLDETMRAMGIEAVDESELTNLCRELLAANRKIAEEIEDGKTKGVGQIIGQAKRKNANINPSRLRERVESLTSGIDQLFERIYGFRPKKAGQAYEMFAAAVLKTLGEHDDVFHDQNLRGIFSKTLYQADVVRRTGGNEQFVEVKDYTERMNKVGRPDLQKLGGALVDLSVSRGLFFSATGYTAPAKKYAAASERIVGKKIDLFHLRPSTTDDEEGRVKTLVIELVVRTPLFENGRMDAIFTPEGRQKAEGALEKGDHRLRIDTIYDASGMPLTTVRELTSQGVEPTWEGESEGVFQTPGGHIKIGDHLIEIEGIKYRVPFATEPRDPN